METKGKKVKRKRWTEGREGEEERERKKEIEKERRKEKKGRASAFLNFDFVVLCYVVWACQMGGWDYSEHRRHGRERRERKEEKRGLL